MSALAAAPAAKKSAVRAVVRVRPGLPTELAQRCLLVDPNDRQTAELVDVRFPNAGGVRYRFDACYDVDSKQEDIYKQEVEPHLQKLFQGQNTTIFAYGMTGAGKTHTMQGSTKEPGIIPRAVKRILELGKVQTGVHIRVSVSYFEIYNEKVIDLIDPTKADLQIRENELRKIVIPGLSETHIQTVQEFDQFYQEKSQNRSTAPTKLNNHSSRSHAILLVKVSAQQAQEPFRKFEGKLHLIDLAGSEDNRRTDNSGERMTESSSINTSLFVLAKVVNALNAKQERIPYRDSKLTRLLQDSLGGSSFGIIIANVAPSYSHYINTQNTLNFANKSRQITNTPMTNVQEDPLYLAKQAEAKKPKADLIKASAPVAEKLHQKKVLQAQIAAKTPHTKTTEMHSKISSARQKYKKGLLKPALDLYTEAYEEYSVDADHDVEILAGLKNQIAKIKKLIADTLKEDIKEKLSGNKENDFTMHSNTTVSQEARKAEATKQNPKKRPAAEEDYSPDVEEVVRPKKIRKTSSSTNDIEQQVVAELRQKINKDDIPKYIAELLKLLNSGSEASLTSLEGIGPKRAKTILELSPTEPFLSLSELTKIGFGAQGVVTFAKRNILENLWVADQSAGKVPCN